ncbi:MULTISPECIES: RNA polymerase sigma factor [Sphingomonadaceae]|uniref:RNA polymerase sigma factor n=1 Tax=Sphingomonadaceae TaxID=41297 RepID=UPI0011580C52|nr:MULTISPECIES: RNA polymerase sigma factor [Sphingomonadaceae]QDK35002.1 RNA polymerase subunit sigma-70 [Sphingomonas sp. IC081]QSR20097.1 RNA polymerase subunit sigma-70 [Novosphingobium sp. KA1]
MSTHSFCNELTALLPRLRRFARGLTQNAADADDLCQTTVERALVARGQWQEGTRLDAWVYRIMRNQWIDETRARSRRAQTFVHEDEGANVGVAGDLDAENRVELGNVDRALARLPAEQREAVVLVLVEGFSYKEAAEIIGIPQGTLTSRLGRGREALLKELGEPA